MSCISDPIMVMQIKSLLAQRYCYGLNMGKKKRLQVKSNYMGLKVSVLGGESPVLWPGIGTMVVIAGVGGGGLEEGELM
jgi:hypothetical protein